MTLQSAIRARKVEAQAALEAASASAAGTGPTLSPPPVVVDESLQLMAWIQWVGTTIETLRSDVHTHSLILTEHSGAIPDEVAARAAADTAMSLDLHDAVDDANDLIEALDVRVTALETP